MRKEKKHIMTSKQAKVLEIEVLVVDTL